MVEAVDGAKIVAAAQAANGRVAATPYQLGGKSETAGLDCSYFVYLALHAVDGGYSYMSSDVIAGSSRFKHVTDPQPGDVVYFPPGQVPYQVSRHNDLRRYPGHVGIVTGPESFVGKQSAAGDGNVGPASGAYPWWASRPHVYLRYQGSNP